MAAAYSVFIPRSLSRRVVVGAGVTAAAIRYAAGAGPWNVISATTETSLLLRIF